MTSSALSAASDRQRLELQAAAVLEMRRRNQSRNTVYGIYRPNGEYGGELVRCIQDSGNMNFVEVDAEPDFGIPEKLEPLITKPKKFKLALGGRGGAKSVGVGGIRSSFAKDYGTKTLCLREMQNTIEDSVHALINGFIQQRNWDCFEVTDKAIRIDGDDVFKFRGIARNPDGVKSMYGFSCGWVEEAQVLSAKSIDILTPTIREAGSEIWFTLNPGSSQDPISQRFLQPFYSQLLRDGYYEDDLHLIIWINYSDNPWHKELEQERAFDEQNMSRNGYRHKWLGHYNDDVDNAIIPAEHFDAAVDAHKKLGFRGEGAKIASYDPSDLGPDDKGYCLRHGSVVLDVCGSSLGDVNEGTDWALDRAINSGADWFTWDGDGMGIALKAQVDKALEGKHIEYQIFRGSETAENPESHYVPNGPIDSKRSKSNKDTFANRRAQYYIWLRDRFAATYRAVEKGEYINPDELISLSSDIADIEQLRAELCRIPLKPNGNGKIQIMSKIEMAKKPYELPSPNLADALMMSMMKPKQVAKERAKINFKGWG